VNPVHICVLKCIELKLAYTAACVGLGCDPGDSVLDELVSLTSDGRDLLDAVQAMRKAAEYHRVFAALELLRDRARERTRNGG
jgi:hypothetical protein